MALPTGKQTSEFQAIEPGTYHATLKRASLSTEKEFKSDAFNDGEGLKYQAINLTWDVDGEEWTERFIKVSLHENAKLFNRLSALLGRKINDTDQVDWGINPQAKKGLWIDDYYRAKEDDAEKGVKKDQLVHLDQKAEGIEGALDSIQINGEELIGRTCLLTLDVNDKGYNRATAGAANPLPKRGAGRRPAPVQAEPEEDPFADEEQAPAPTPARGRRQPPAGAPT